MADAALRKMFKWTDEQEVLLIECVREKRHLWDIKDEFYVNRTLKRCSYQEIAETLIAKFPESEKLFTVDLLINKFGNLRTQFRKLYVKTAQPSGSTSIGFLPKWKHYYNLQFLGDTVEPTQSTSSLPERLDATKENVDPELNNYDYFSQEQDETSLNLDSSVILDSNSEIQSPTAINKGKKRKRKNSNEVREFALEALQELNDKCEDEEELYGHYIAQVLRSFDPVKKDLCKLEFAKVILNMRHNVTVTEQ